MDLANPSYMGQAAQMTNILPGIQSALLGQQQIQAQNLELQKAQEAMRQQQQFQADYAQVLAKPTPHNINLGGTEITENPIKDFVFLVAPCES